MGKKVHIASSNIKLSIRDYEESFKYFNLLDIKPAVLLHSNELPKSVKNKFNIDSGSFSHDEKETTDEFHNIDDDIFEDFDCFKFYYFDGDKDVSRLYPFEFFNSELFKNSSRMNFSVCGLNEDNKKTDNSADIVFSTFVNFECLYLKMIELFPGSVKPYFKECCLLIDEADSILIDEIANGTIVSRPMKSNSTEILKFVYEQYQNKLSYHETYEKIKQNKKWAICKDLKEENIMQMYEEIEIVHRPEYTNGKKYSIEQIKVTGKKKQYRFAKEALNLAKNIISDIATNFVKEFTKDENENSDDDDDDDDNDDEYDEKDNDEEPAFFNYIVPFSYDRNGILEPNKEFSGFLQQFIAIKESVENDVKNMIVNDITMSYLYVSHPIFVNLYGSVCGFTGTLGSKSDRKLLKDEYGLDSLEIPRYNPNLSVEFPILICNNIEERNYKIICEVIEFHKREIPVLVIFQGLNEIQEVKDMLNSQGIKNINIFDGKDDIIKPEEIAVFNSAVSLGTNFCGRGTNIKTKRKPLHVIVSYFSSNTRVMFQAFGRTARQGKKGTYRIICTENQFFVPTDILKNANNSINEFAIKNKRQKEYVDHFMNSRKWIFSNDIKKQMIDNKSIKYMRKAKINVNRIIAYNYAYPICMSKDVFLTIQAQKIFSIFNCPNSQFTWKLFQRYIREMILESWSLMINELDQK